MGEAFERLFDATAIPILERTAAFTQARHRALLSNVANATTPGYRAQDLAEGEFSEQLARAAAERDRRGGPLRLRSSSHNRVEDDGTVRFRPVLSPRAGPADASGNTVDLEREAVALLRNTFQHNVATELMRKQFALIEAAIRERP